MTDQPKLSSRFDAKLYRVIRSELIKKSLIGLTVVAPLRALVICFSLLAKYFLKGGKS